MTSVDQPIKEDCAKRIMCNILMCYIRNVSFQVLDLYATVDTDLWTLA